MNRNHTLGKQIKWFYLGSSNTLRYSIFISHPYTQPSFCLYNNITDNTNIYSSEQLAHGAADGGKLNRFLDCNLRYFALYTNKHMPLTPNRTTLFKSIQMCIIVKAIYELETLAINFHPIIQDFHGINHRFTTIKQLKCVIETSIQNVTCFWTLH